MNITDEDLAAYCELFDLDPTEINAEGHRRDLEVFSRHRMTARRKALEDAAKAVENERLEDPDYETSDEVYETAITDAVDAIRAMIEGETK